MASGRAEGASVRRIIVDCTHIAPHPAPTGIPRVVQNYVQHGTPIANRAGVEVLCAEAGPDGFHRRDLGAIAAPAPRAVTRRDKLHLEALRYGSRVLAALARLVGALVPIRQVRLATGAWEERSLALVSSHRHRRPCAARPAGEPITLGPGDILFCPGYWHDTDATVYARAREEGAEVIFLVHDLLPITLPAYHLYPWRQHFEARVSASLGVVDQYYCISRQTRQALLEHGAWLGRQPRATVAYNGFDPATHTPDAPPEDLAAVLSRAPWLMVGTLEPKKGHEEAIAVFSRLWSEGYERPLVIVGRQGWMSEAVRHMIRCSPWAGRQLFWFDGLDDGAVAAAYAASHALLFASEAEGFGLPLLEGVAHGLPVLARDIPVVREVMGATGFCYRGREGLATAIGRLEEPACRTEVLAQQGTLLWWDWPTVAEALFTDLLRAPGQRSETGLLMDPIRRVPVRRQPTAETRKISPNRKKVASIR